MNMRKKVLFLLLLSSTFLHAQNIRRNQHFIEIPGIDSKAIRDAEEKAFKLASSNNIYSYDALMDYITTKNISVDEVSEINGLKKIFQRVVGKKKKFRESDKPVWKQEYYNFEYDFILSSIKEESEEIFYKDSIQRNNWTESETYLALKLYKQYKIPQVNDSILLLLEKYNVDIDNYTYHDWGNHYYKPKEIIGKYQKNVVEDITPSDTDYYFVKEYLESNKYFWDTSIVKLYELYEKILQETGYHPLSFVSARDPLRKYINIKSRKELFEQDKNNDNVLQLKMLINYYKDENNKQLWKRYCASKSEKLKDACFNLNEALEYRKNHPLVDGIYRYNSKDDEKNRNDINKYHYVEIPYKVQGDSLIPHGTCVLHVFTGQYPNADGDWYRQYTLDAKVYINVENGVAISKKVTGFHKVWGPDKRVWDRTKGNFLQKTSAVIHAKPAVERVNDLSKLDNYQIEVMLSSNHIEELMRTTPYTYDDVSIENLCSRYLIDPTYRTACLELIKFPIKNIDMSKLK